jgi:hypothetical protein
MKTWKLLKSEFLLEIIVCATLTAFLITLVIWVLIPEPDAAITEPEITIATEPATEHETVCEEHIREWVEYWESTYRDNIADYCDEPAPPMFTEDEVELLAKTVWGEARGLSIDEQRLVIWTVLQRVDDDNRWGDTIEAVITAPRQFNGYRERNPVTPEIHALVVQELTDWHNGENPPTHELFAPNAPYFFFDGDGTNNWFREVWR